MERHADPALVQRAIEGSRSAVETLWSAHRRWVAVVIVAHMPAEAEVEDLLQEVALTLVRRISELQEPQRFRPWLRTVALNAARSAGRKATVRRRVLRPLDDDAHQMPDTSAQQITERLEVASTAQRALAHARDLAPEYREPLLLRCLQGMSQRQIAEALEIPETTVETRLARARRMLRQSMNDTESAQGHVRVAGGQARRRDR